MQLTTSRSLVSRLRVKYLFMICEHFAEIAPATFFFGTQIFSPHSAAQTNDPPECRQGPRNRRGPSRGFRYLLVQNMLVMPFAYTDP